VLCPEQLGVISLNLHYGGENWILENPFEISGYEIGAISNLEIDHSTQFLRFYRIMRC